MTPGFRARPWSAGRARKHRTEWCAHTRLWCGSGRSFTVPLSLHRDWNTHVELRIDCDAVLHRGEEAPLLESIEQDLVESRIGGRRHQRHFDFTLVGNNKVSYCQRL